MELLHRIKMLCAFLSLVKDPTKTDLVFYLSDKSRSQPGILLVSTVSFISEQPGFLDLFKHSYNPRLPSLEILAAMPDGSLGKEFSRHIVSNGLDLDFFPLPAEGGLVGYLMTRVRKQHDFWHVLAGFDTSVSGEIGLQAFVLAQLRSPFSALLVAGGILHGLAYNQRIFLSLVDQIFHGYQLGKRCRPLIGIRLEEQLHRSVREIREELGIEVCGDAINAYATPKVAGH